MCFSASAWCFFAAWVSCLILLAENQARRLEVHDARREPGVGNTSPAGARTWA